MIEAELGVEVEAKGEILGWPAKHPEKVRRPRKNASPKPKPKK